MIDGPATASSPAVRIRGDSFDLQILGREYWEATGEKISGPTPKEPTREVIVHWPGISEDKLPVGLENTFRWLRNAQSYSLRTFGYSLYYNWCIPKGVDAVIEIRGDDFNNAANKGDKRPENVNAYTKSALVMTAGGMDETQYQLLAKLCARNYPGLPQLPHSAVEYTECPGPVGLQLPATLPTTPPTNPPDQEDDTMFVGYVKHKDSPHVYKQWSNGTKTWVSHLAIPVENFLGNPFPPANSPQMNYDDAWMAATGVIVGPRPSGVNGWGVPD